MRDIFGPKRNIIVADFDYQSILFAFKNKHPELDIKIINRADLINMLSFSFKKDPVPFLIANNYGYKKAKKYLDVLLTSDIEKNSEIKEIYNLLKDNVYLTQDEYGPYELKNSKLFLFEMEEDYSITELLKRSDMGYENLSFSDLDIKPNPSFDEPLLVCFENKMSQFTYIFSSIRKKALTNPNLKFRVVIDGEADIFYAKIASDLFKLPICYSAEKPLLSIRLVKERINKIYETKSFDFDEAELADPDIKTLKELVDYYGLNTGNNFDYNYANLLEIVAATTIKETIGDKGIILTSKYSIDDKALTYITNFTAKSFYKMFADDNVLPDASLKKIGYNPSYIKSVLEKRKKINFLKYNNVVLVSRVKKHLNDGIYDSPLLKELSWVDKVKNESNIVLPVLTDDAFLIDSLIELDKKQIRNKPAPYETYDHLFKGINSGDYFVKKTWSVTNLESYIRCPFKYYLNIVVPLKTEDYDRRFNGTFIHKVLEKLNHDNYDIDQAFAEGEKEYYQAFAREGVTPKQSDMVALEVRKHWLRHFVKTYLDVSREISFVKPVLNDYEQHISFKLKDGANTEYVFNGRIDKIFVTEFNNKKYYSIIDYKTGVEEFNPLEVFLGKSTQLPLYYYAINNSLQPSSYTKGGEFGGFYIQHIYFSTINKCLNSNSDIWLKESNLISASKLEGLNRNDFDYLNSIGKIQYTKKNTPSLSKMRTIRISHQFTTPYAKENVIDDEIVTRSKYNLEDLVNDAKEATINTIKKVCAADFPIKPTFSDLAKRDFRRTSCDYCQYRAICYRDIIKDAVDYEKEIINHFK